MSTLFQWCDVHSLLYTHPQCNVINAIIFVSICLTFNFNYWPLNYVFKIVLENPNHLYKIWMWWVWMVSICHLSWIIHSYYQIYHIIESILFAFWELMQLLKNDNNNNAIYTIDISQAYFSWVRMWVCVSSFKLPAHIRSDIA